MDYQKLEAETILVKADLSPLLDLTGGEAVDSVSVVVLKHGTGSTVEDLDLSACDRIAVELLDGSGVTYRRSFDVGALTDARIVLYAASEEAADMLDEESVDEDGNVVELFENVAAVRLVGGSSGFTYRVRFTATTTFGCLRVLDRTVEVIP
jgi:hypothetical protein